MQEDPPEIGPGKMNDAHPSVNHSNAPAVSIILPVRNERAHITRCIESIFNQREIHKCEVLVIDGMSDDGTRETLAGIQKKHPGLLIVDNPGKTVTGAVNLGITAAKADIIMRMDAHAAYAPDYIAVCLRVMNETGAANVGGQAFALPSRHTPAAHAIALAHHSAFGLGGASFRNINAQGFVETVWPGCFKKEVFNRVGLLNNALQRSEDIEVNYRIRKAGYRIYLSPEIKVGYFCRATIPSLWSQRWLDGKGIVQTLWVNAGAVRLRHLVPLSVTMLCIAVMVWGITALLINSTAAFRAAAATAGFGATAYGCMTLLFTLLSLRDLNTINTRIKHDGMESFLLEKRSAALLPLVFATLHFSYGLGSIAGLLQRPKIQDH
jgi:succinoglycan biosynthesis protein ExoA